MNLRPPGYEPDELPDCSTSPCYLKPTGICMSIKFFHTLFKKLFFSSYSYSFFFILLPLNVTALNSPSSAHLFSLMKAIKPHSKIDIGIEIKIKKGWHTYWKNPGDMGFPMKVQWELPREIKVEPLKWPRPQRIRFEKWDHFGYKKNILILTRLNVPSSYGKKNLPIQAHVTWLVCKKVCVPMEQKLSLNIPTSQYAKINPKMKKKFLQAKALTPQKFPFQGFLKNDQIFLKSKKTFQFIDFFPIRSFTAETPNVSKKNNNFYILRFSKNFEKKQSFPALVVYKKNKKTQSSRVLIQVQKQSIQTLLVFLLLAFLGGLALNFMPCVLPVVFLKFYYAVRSRQLILSSTMYSTGVVLSFLGLGFLIDLLKTSSYKLGWGFQMQSPLFIIFLILFFTFVGFSFLDLFYIPKFLKSLKWDSKNWIGGLFSGLLAVLSATPCTAPFMGAAVGFAFSQPTINTLLVFTFLGLGMSSPYILLSFFPKLIKKIPHPGKWNKNFKHLLALPMWAVSIWLIYILIHIHPSYLLPILTALIGYGFAFWILKSKLYSKSYAVLLLISSLLLTFYPVYKQSKVQISPVQTEKFSALHQLDQLRIQNKPVLLTITAKWCLTCHMNDFTTLKNKKIIKFLNQHKITSLHVDWTSRNEEILIFLEKYNRKGIPFTIFFPKNHKTPLVLPELLTPNLLTRKITPHL